MQSVVALRPRGKLQCTALIDGDKSPQLDVEISLDVHNIRLHNVYHITYIHFYINLVVKDGIARLCYHHAQFSGDVLAIRTQEHRFALHLPEYNWTSSTSELYFTANQMLEILQTMRTACTEYPSMAQGLLELFNWVKQ
jgi:hypothetical protein